MISDPEDRPVRIAVLDHFRAIDDAAMAAWGTFVYPEADGRGLLAG
jgi:hypothetical protein